MDKLHMETPDLSQTNIEKLAALFPACVTEARGKDGKLKKAVNFELLRQMLSDMVLEGDEAYEFTWVGKKAAIVEANRPIRKTLRPCPAESVDWDTTENLYIEGDNLEVLKLLQESYLGKVKMIYIDPPYNTGNDFIYRDDFAQSQEEYSEESGQKDEETGDRLFRNTDSNGRFHSDWCSMIYSRLMLTRNLLTDDGVIFISIDDNEAANLIKIGSELFGGDCFAADISWQRTYAPRNDSHGISAEKEHLIVFSKLPGWMPKKLPRTAEMNAKYKSPDGDPILWRPDNPCAPGAMTHQGMVYGIQHPFTGKILYPSNGACWRYQQSDMLKIMAEWGQYELKDLHDEKERAIVCGVTADTVRSGVFAIVLSNNIEEARKFARQRYAIGKWPIYYFTNNGNGGIAKKTYLNEKNGKVVTNLWPYSEVGHTDEAKKELLSLFDGKSPFDTPKPLRLIERIIDISTECEDTILDFFSGSGTTAHAIFSRNVSKDGSHRHFILVQLQEKSGSSEFDTLCDVGKERIRRAAKKIAKRQPLRAVFRDSSFADSPAKINVGEIFKMLAPDTRVKVL